MAIVRCVAGPPNTSRHTTTTTVKTTTTLITCGQSIGGVICITTAMTGRPMSTAISDMGRKRRRQARQRHNHRDKPHATMSNNEPVDGRCNATTRDGGYCANYPKGDAARCRMHGADSNGGAPEGNDNAVTVGAWSESFVSDFLRDDEIARVEKATDVLDQPETAQELGQTVAAICLEQFRRTGDERFIRRFESICDKFQIAPEEAVEHNVNLTDVLLNDE